MRGNLLRQKGPELTYFSIFQYNFETLKIIRSIFLDQEFLRARIPGKKISLENFVPAAEN